MNQDILYDAIAEISVYQREHPEMGEELEIIKVKIEKLLQNLPSRTPHQKQIDWIYKRRNYEKAGCVKLSSQIVIVDKNSMRHLGTNGANTEMTLPFEKRWDELIVNGQHIVTLRNDYGDGKYPVFAKLDVNKHLMSIVISFLEKEHCRETKE